MRLVRRTVEGISVVLVSTMLVLSCPKLLVAAEVAKPPNGSGTQVVEAPDLDGRTVRLFAPTGAVTRATVLIFVSNDCPIANKYAPEIARIYKEFSPRGITFWLVHPNNDETTASIRKHAREYSLKMNVLRDPARALVKAARATTTPEAAVFSNQGALLYHGRIDDRFPALGQQRAAPTTRELRDALAAVLDGRVPAKDHATPVGCSIPELP